MNWKTSLYTANNKSLSHLQWDEHREQNIISFLSAGHDVIISWISFCVAWLISLAMESNMCIFGWHYNNINKMLYLHLRLSPTNQVGLTNQLLESKIKNNTNNMWRQYIWILEQSFKTRINPVLSVMLYRHYSFTLCI